ncbi:patatin-like phospholipase family protein [Halothermothrix orenii]|uniref:Patatin n=1 Tax=Halothermothrix orenii (strain H 168 / OCM 544 / DSM 9562) TaxID=373903 RepID=B8CWV4_HALOH|nr:patatin-like phospholipase family protein [Halothermothrix orenii]ACL69773.1 Patatin [Halothermothrix orenii H 168]
MVNGLKIGIALGAGAARGLAHIGVLEVLEEEDIEVDMVAGSSIGSLIGGIYACGVPLRYIKGLASEINWDHITDITFPRKGLIKGDKLLSFLEIITSNKDISELEIPFAAVACDIEKGELIVIKDGPLAKAIRASTSIPGIYVPYFYKNRLLVDGAVLDRVPVSIVKEMGADVVIAVDVGVKNINKKVNNMFDVLFNTFDIMQHEMDKYRKIESDILIRPDLGYYSSFDLDRAEHCIQLGYRAARDSLPEIMKIIEERVE